MTYKSINPATLEKLGEFPLLDNTLLEDKLKISKNVFLTWKNLSIDERLRYVKEIGLHLKSDLVYHAKLISTEMGKPFTQAKTEIEKCILLCDFYFDNAKSLIKDKEFNENGKLSYITYEPMGIIYGIMPWNFPYWQVFRFFIPNIILGNTTLLKHASNVPQCALAIEKIVKSAGVPDGVFTNLFIDYQQSEKVISFDGVCGVTLTGSEMAGSKVAELAGKNLKKTVLELGGSDPFIVFDDADIDKAVEIGLFARMQNAGQSCIASKRFLIHQSVFDNFTEKFILACNNLKMDSPLSEDTELGPLANPYLLEELENQVNTSVRLGAKVLCGGGVLEKGRLFYKPTVITDVNQGMPLFKEEVFGPVAVFFKFNSDVEAIELANNTEFGLGASVWTKNIEKAMKVAKNIVTGTVAINGLVKSDPKLPFGGVKKSGFGRELGELGLKEFANIKTINVF